MINDNALFFNRARAFLPLLAAYDLSRTRGRVRFIVACRVRLASADNRTFVRVRFVDHVVVIAAFDRALVDAALFKNSYERTCDCTAGFGVRFQFDFIYSAL